MEKVLDHVGKPSQDEVGTEAEAVEPTVSEKDIELLERAEDQPAEEKPRSTCMMLTPPEVSTAPWLGLVPPGVGLVALAVLLI
jgi:hypothetical protein